MSALWAFLALGGAVLTLGGWRAVMHRVHRTWARIQRRSLEADEYGARQLVQRTLDAKADLRRRAPASRSAARRYQRLLALELASLEELERQMRDDVHEPEAEQYLAEARAELAQLRNEVAWCRRLLQRR